MTQNTHYQGLIPAHAGKTTGATATPSRTGAHPRSRGENWDGPNGPSRWLGSSPLTRGKRRSGCDQGRRRRLIPAHAGKTRQRIRRQERHRAHPRSRGENEDEYGIDPMDSGSSPLTRGKRSSAAHRRLTKGLIPAHAGKTRSTREERERPRAHPRSRGENLSALIDGSGQKGSSPLTRGKLRQRRQGHPVHGLIPAHAGKTPTVRLSPRASWAHPRSRGENLASYGATIAACGSSPLTRGKLGCPIPPAARGGLIPAHAGKTLS